MRTIDVICLGEALVDFLPSRLGPLSEVPSFDRHPGGAPANVAIGVARLGGVSALVGAVGEDPFGSYVLGALEREGVSVEWMSRQPGGKTGLAFVSLDDAGRPRFYSPGTSVAELSITAPQVEAVSWKHAKVLHFSTALLRAQPAREATFTAVRRAREAGCLVAFDPNLRLHHLSDTSPLSNDLAALLPQADVVKLSSEECAFVTGQSDPREAARRLASLGPSLVVVTCGPDGCVWARGDDEGRLTTRAAEVIDTTGAGDGFQALLVTALARLGSPAHLSKESLERVLSIACEVGTRVCEKLGAVAGLPRADELGFESLLEDALQ